MYGKEIAKILVSREDIAKRVKELAELNDLRIGVEEAARRKGGGEQRQRSQFQYTFDFHGVMLRLNR